MAPALPVRPAGYRQTEKMRGYILQTGQKRAIMNPQAEPLPAGCAEARFSLIRNPNYAERNVPICLLSRAPP